MENSTRGKSLAGGDGVAAALLPGGEFPRPEVGSSAGEANEVGAGDDDTSQECHRAGQSAMQPDEAWLMPQHRSTVAESKGPCCHLDVCRTGIAAQT